MPIYIFVFDIFKKKRERKMKCVFQVKNEIFWVRLTDGNKQNDSKNGERKH